MKKKISRGILCSSRKGGFSLLELLLVVIIIGLVLAFIIPKLIALRVEARHEMVRQSCSELSGTVQQWVEKSMLAQDDQLSIATLGDYVGSLANREPPDSYSTPAKRTGQWIGTKQRPNNWNNNNIDRDVDNQRLPISGRWIGAQRDTPPETTVADLIPGEKIIKNPFSSTNVFTPENDPLVGMLPVPGAIAFCSFVGPDRTISYGFCFQGQGSTTLDWGSETTFHGPQNLLSLQGLGYCTIFAQFR